jgi:hypothetical protein
VIDRPTDDQLRVWRDPNSAAFISGPDDDQVNSIAAELLDARQLLRRLRPEFLEMLKAIHATEKCYSEPGSVKRVSD